MCLQDARVCLLRANTADQMLDIVFPAFPKLGVKLDDVVLVNFAMWMNTCAATWPHTALHPSVRAVSQHVTSFARSWSARVCWAWGRTDLSTDLSPIASCERLLGCRRLSRRAERATFDLSP